MLPEEVLDLRLEVYRQTDGAFHTIATLGTERAEGDFMLSVSRDDVRRAIFQSDAASSATVGRRSVAGSSDPLRGLGTQLFSRVFEGPASRIYQLTRPRGGVPPMPLRLSILAQDTASSDLPWEYLYDARTEGFVALTPGVSIVRLAPVPRTDTPSVSLRVALVVIDPIGAFGGREEEEVLRRIASTSDCFTVTRVDGLALDTLAAALEGADVLHYVGLGNGKADAPVLHWATEPLRVHQLVTALPASVRVVYLSADATDAFASALAANVSTSIGVRGTIPIDAALTFCDAFYRRVLSEDPVDEAFAFARRAVASAHPAARAWGLPLLFTHHPGMPLLRSARPLVARSPADVRPTELGNARAVLAAVRAMNIEALTARIEALGTDAPRFLHDQLESEQALMPVDATQVD